MTIADTIKSLGARATMSENDVRSLLEKDHDEVKAILRDLVEGQRGSSRARLLETLKRKLTAHSRAEEQVVYNALIRARANRDVHVSAEEGYVEHGAVDDLLARISRLEVGTELWSAHAKVIRELLEHHIAEEQNEIFAQLGDLFDRDELATMGAEFLRRKARVLTQQASKTKRSVARVVAGQRGRKSARRAPAKKASGKRKPVSGTKRLPRPAGKTTRQKRTSERRTR